VWTFFAIVAVVIGVPIIKSIIRDAQREERRARAAERRQRAKARAAAAAPRAAPSPPTSVADGQSLIDNIGEAVVDGIVDADDGAESQGGSAPRVRAPASSDILLGDRPRDNHTPADGPVEAEDTADDAYDDDDRDDDDRDDDDRDDDGSGWSWDDD